MPLSLFLHNIRDGIFPSSVLLPSLASLLRQYERVTDL
jgi:hypothetical protein